MKSHGSLCASLCFREISHLATLIESYSSTTTSLPPPRFPDHTMFTYPPYPLLPARFLLTRPTTTPHACTPPLFCFCSPHLTKAAKRGLCFSHYTSTANVSLKILVFAFANSSTGIGQCCKSGTVREGEARREPLLATWNFTNFPYFSSTLKLGARGKPPNMKTKQQASSTK